MDRPRGCARSTLGGFVLIMFVVLSFTTGLTLTFDQLCYSEMKLFMPDYPDADVIFRENSFLRPYGIGATVVQLYSEDEQETVNRWYAINYRERIRNDRRLSTVRFSITENGENGGTDIILYGWCVVQDRRASGGR